MRAWHSIQLQCGCFLAQKRKSNNISFKLKVIESLENKSEEVHVATYEFGIDLITTPVKSTKDVPDNAAVLLTCKVTTCHAHCHLMLNLINNSCSLIGVEVDLYI